LKNTKKIAISVAIGIGFLIIAMTEGSYFAYLPNENGIVCEGSANCFTGTVNEVIDGDTIVVDEVDVRLSLTSTPELDETYGIEAKEFTESICPVGSNALVDEDDGQTGGSFGRTIAKVYCGKTLLNSALLDNDLATIDTTFCDVSEFAAEDWAQKYGCQI
jgi:endonuclease YncB( thermonuclease family)